MGDRASKGPAEGSAGYGSRTRCDANLRRAGAPRVRGVDQTRAVQAVVGAEVELSADVVLRDGRPHRGGYRLVFGHDAGEFQGLLREVSRSVAPSRLVWTNDEGDEQGAVTTVTFDEEDDGRTRLVLQRTLSVDGSARPGVRRHGGRDARAVRAAGREFSATLLAAKADGPGGRSVHMESEAPWARCASRVLPCPSTASAPARTRAWSIRSAKGGAELHNWFYPTRTFRSMIGQEGGTDDRFARAAAEGFGAFILGRNMFGPAGDGWGGPDWKGWWGDNPRITRRPSSSPTTPGRPS